MTIATRAVAGPSGSDACSVIQPTELGTATTSPPGSALGRVRAKAATAISGVGGVSSLSATAGWRNAAMSSRAGSVISSTWSDASSTTIPGEPASSCRRAASKRSEVRIPSATVAVMVASASTSSRPKSRASSRRATCTAPQHRPRATNAARSSNGMPAGWSTSR